MSRPSSAETAFPSIGRSLALLERAERLIPSATQTLAKGPGQHVRGVAPVFAHRGKGGHLWDVDGNEFIDLTMGVGPISLGYAFPYVDDAIRRQLTDGITFSLMHPLEVEVAELVHSLVPNAEMVRFSKTGADVTSAAIRLARAYTHRDTVLCCGYHGWHDWYIGTTDRSRGVPPATQGLSYTFAYNDIESVINAIDDDTAAVILEPTVFDAPQADFLQELRRVCDHHGVLLIFDEMWTGFRLSLGGAQEHFGVRADLACFSKAVANGMPLSILSGRREVMSLLDGDVFFYTTFGGEALSLAAAKATIEFMSMNAVIPAIAHTGKQLRDGYNAVAHQLGLAYTSAKGFDCRSVVTFDPHAGDPLLMKSFVQQELLRRGILWGGFHNVCYSHTDADIATVLGAYAEVLPLLDDAVRTDTVRHRLAGDPMQPVFRKTSGFNTKPRSSKEAV
jgi:glutamate-1-semialdehyde aminotransferase